MEKLAQKLTIRYSLLQGTYWISQCCIFSFATVYLQYKNFANTQIGFVLSFAAVLSIILQPLIASFADKTTNYTLRHIVIGLMFVVFTLGVILLFLPNSFFLLSITYITIIAIQVTLNSLFNALALEYINKGIPMNYGLARGMGSITFAITSFLVGICVTRYGAGILLLIFLVSYLFVIASAFYFKVEIPENYKSKDELLDQLVALSDKNITSTELEIKNQPESSSSNFFSFFIKYKQFGILLIGFVLLWYSHNVINTYLINIIENVGGNSTDLGISLSIAAALELPTMAMFIYLVRKIKCSTLLKISAFFFLVKVIITWIAPSVLMVHISQGFQLFAFALYTPASIYYVNSLVDDKDKVKGQSMLGVASFGVAGIIANLTGGKVLDMFGVSNMLLVATIVTAIGFVIVYLFTQDSNS